MNKSNTFVLIHSPLVGGLTWKPVADEMKQRGLSVFVPFLKDSPDSSEPFWKQHAKSVSEALADIPKKQSVILVAHSGAGPLLPAIRQFITNPVDAYVFVDAGIPRDGASRLELMKSEDAEWARRFQEQLEHGGRFPNWSSSDLRKIISDANLRKQLVAENNPRALPFFTEPIPVFGGWPDAPCVYIQFSPPYERSAAHAKQAGWKRHKLEAGHFHMLVDPIVVANTIIEVLNKLR